MLKHSGNAARPGSKGRTGTMPSPTTPRQSAFSLTNSITPSSKWCVVP